MIIARNDSEDIALEWSTHTAIENILNTALIEDKGKWYSRLEKLKYEYEGQEMIEDLKQYLPVMGFHRLEEYRAYRWPAKTKKNKPK